jgi:hypothetical protein
MTLPPDRYVVVNPTLTRLNKPPVPETERERLRLIAREKVRVKRREMFAEPSGEEMARNFAGATAKWVKAGLPVVPREIYEARGAVCETCEFWDGAARFGLGKCNAPGCGCTKFKRWLATEKCPLKKWPELPAKEPDKPEPKPAAA